MIIRSKSNTFLFWLIVVLTIFLSGVTIYTLLTIPDNTPRSGVIAICLVSFLNISLCVKKLWDTNCIVIDTQLKEIIFKNRVSQKSQVFRFSDFDGYIVINEPARSGYLRNIYLVKNKKGIRKVEGRFYSNLNEIESALSEIKNMGITYYSYWQSFKILFGWETIE